VKFSHIWQLRFKNREFNALLPQVIAGAFDPLSGSFTDICSFTPPVGYDYSRIKGVAKAPQGYWINFWEQLFFLPEGSTCLEPTEITYHSFTIVHDRFQPILWIGADSKGLIGWNYQEPTMKCLTYRDLPCKISMPVRCIHADSDTRVLLFGTKGDGLVRVMDFSKNGEISETDIDILHTGNSVLSDNSVYCISENRHGSQCLKVQRSLLFHLIRHRKIRRGDDDKVCS